MLPEPFPSPPLCSRAARVDAAVALVGLESLGVPPTDAGGTDTNRRALMPMVVALVGREDAGDAIPMLVGVERAMPPLGGRFGTRLGVVPPAACVGAPEVLGDDGTTRRATGDAMVPSWDAVEIGVSCIR